jgi:hypothetical protein
MNWVLRMEVERQKEDRQEMIATSNTCQEVNLVTLQSVREYLALLWERYQWLKLREEKGEVLDEICRNLKVHRKTANRWMRGKKPPGRGRERGKSFPRKRYSAEATEHLRRLWRQMGYIGSTRIKAALPDWLNHYDCSSEIKIELVTMSASTIERKLKKDKAELRRRMNTGTRRGKTIVTQIPLRDLGVTPEEPGHCEIDTVAHCGDSMSGSFIWTLTVTDIVSGWTECEAIKDKTGVDVRLALEAIEERLPFRLRALYSDNGSEFLNHDVLNCFAKRPGRQETLLFFRGRPYRKNDQCFVEQKNFTHVRQAFGYDRLSGKVALNKMNTIYAKEWRLLQNFFLPQARLLEKTRIGSRLMRRMDVPKTPYQRLLDHPKVSEEIKSKLRSERENMNPFELRKRLTKKLRDFARFLKYPWTTPFRGKFHDDPSKK